MAGFEIGQTVYLKAVPPQYMPEMPFRVQRVDDNGFLEVVLPGGLFLIDPNDVRPATENEQN